MFYEDLSRGKKGEAYVRNLMAARNHKVKDVSNNYSIGFDFYIDEKKCELKTDYKINESGNLFLEDYVRYSKGGYGAGWLRTCKADYLLYLDEKSGTLYIYSLNEIRTYLEQNYVPLRSLDDGYKTIFGYCLPHDTVRHQTIKRGN